MFNYLFYTCILAFSIALTVSAAPNINGADMPGALINRQRQIDMYDQKAPWVNKAVTVDDLSQEDNIYYDEAYLDEYETYTDINVLENKYTE